LKDVAVYFFENGATNAGVPANYPADAKIGYFNVDGTENKIGTVKVMEAGEYIVSFVADAKTLETAYATSYIDFEFANIKLTAILPEKEPEVPAASKKSGVKWGKMLLVVLIFLVALVAAYMAVGRLCPEWIDQFLYTPEELEILNR
jgi:hypothetical protein